MNIYNYAKNKGLRLYHRPLFNRVTDDNKGVKSFHSKPYSFPIQSGFIPLVAGSLKLQIAFLVYCFIACKSMKFSETSYRISKKYHYSPVYFVIFSITKRPCSFEQSLFLDLKLSTHQQSCRCLLNFSLHVSCVLQVQRVQPYQVQHLTMQLILIVLHQC